MATITIQVPILSPYYQFTVKNIVEDNHDNDNNITNFNMKGEEGGHLVGVSIVGVDGLCGDNG